MAWDVFGNICIASFIAPNTVQCYNRTTAVLTHDYASEIQAASIQPVGLRFGPNNNLTVNSVFNGQVWVEAVENVRMQEVTQDFARMKQESDLLAARQEARKQEEKSHPKGVIPMLPKRIPSNLRPLPHVLTLPAAKTR
jgi:hypothetical protein